ncbi:hypothetical protein D3C80_2174280 [compost metagenome]
MGAVGTPAVGAGAFVLILVNIDPAIVIAFLQHTQVIIAERLQAFFGDFLSFFKGDVQLIFVHKRSEQVIHM